MFESNVDKRLFGCYYYATGRKKSSLFRKEAMMKNENMTFAQLIRSKRLRNREYLTLKNISEKLGISLTMYSDIEKGRRVPGETFDYEGLAEILGLDSSEKALMYDLAAKRKRTIPSDIEDVMMYSEAGNLARLALRMTNEGTADEEDWKRFIRELEEKRRKKE